MSDYLEIGKIVNTQGVKGDMRVIPFTFDIKRFERLKEVKVRIRKEERLLQIEKVWYHKQFVILKCKGIDDMTAAERCKEGVLYIPREEALPLEEDEYYIGDLFQVRVFTEEGEELGEIADVLQTGANDVYVVKNTAGSEILIPAIKQCILHVALEEKRMVVRLLEGLR